MLETWRWMRQVRYLPIWKTEPVSYQINKRGTALILWESYPGGEAKEGLSEERTAEPSPER